MERHQTLRNTIDWSYDLLDERERTALNRLSVFAGGCDLHAAEHILEREGLDALDVIDTLDLLVDKSLVLADPDDSGHVRYRLLETIRQYAQERLEASGEASEIRRRHADHFVSVAEAAGPGLRSREQLAWAHAVAPETDNLRAALDWAVETPSAEHALRLVAPLMAHSIPIGNAAKAWAEMAIAIPDAVEHRLYPDVASWATEAAIARGDLASAEQYAAAIGERRGPARRSQRDGVQWPGQGGDVSRRLRRRPHQERGVRDTVTSRRRCLRVVPSTDATLAHTGGDR